jgi:hypothetical protein
LNKTLMFNQGTESTYNIKKNNKGEYVARFMNSIPIEDVLPPPPDQRIFVFTTVAPTTTIINNQTQVNNTTINSTNVTQDGNINVNMNVNAGGIQASSTSTSTSVATSTTSQSTTIVSNGDNPPHPNHPDHYVMPGYNGPIGCPYPISDLDFADVKRSIASKSFEDSKLSIAKEVTSSNCLFATEVKEIMLLFSFEDTRLTFAKFAYKYTYDKGNYYKVNDAFTFESSIDELREYTRNERD